MAQQEAEQPTENFLVRTIDCFGADPQKRLDNPANVDIYSIVNWWKDMGGSYKPTLTVRVACPYLATKYFAPKIYYFCQAAKSSQEVAEFEEELNAAEDQTRSEFPNRREEYKMRDRIKELMSQKFAACYRANPQ